MVWGNMAKTVDTKTPHRISLWGLIREKELGAMTNIVEPRSAPNLWQPEQGKLASAPAKKHLVYLHKPTIPMAFN
jgi:hypothetical protein